MHVGSLLFAMADAGDDVAKAEAEIREVKVEIKEVKADIKKVKDKDEKAFLYKRLNQLGDKELFLLKRGSTSQSGTFLCAKSLCVCAHGPFCVTLPIMCLLVVQDWRRRRCVRLQGSV